MDWGAGSLCKPFFWRLARFSKAAVLPRAYGGRVVTATPHVCWCCDGLIIDPEDAVLFEHETADWGDAKCGPWLPFDGAGVTGTSRIFPSSSGWWKCFPGVWRRTGCLNGLTFIGSRPLESAVERSVGDEHAAPAMGCNPGASRPGEGSRPGPSPDRVCSGTMRAITAFHGASAHHHPHRYSDSGAGRTVNSLVGALD